LRELTEDERETLARRREGFDGFVAERMPVLADFAKGLALDEPAMIVADPQRYLPAIDAFMRSQTILEEDRFWILTRIGYFVGEVLVQRLGGCWLLNEVPDTRSFLRYVVGSFARVENPNAMVDPFQAVFPFLIEPVGRDLTGLLAQVEAELRRA